MANVVISGDTSGSVVLTVPAIAGTSTFTLQGPTGTLVAGGPAFSAYRSGTAQSPITPGVYTKIQFNTEDFDTNSNYDPNALYRFTPTISGYYQINLSLETATTLGNVPGFFLAIYKNGSIYCEAGATATNSIYTISHVIFFNGTTDYVEGYVNTYASSGTISVANSTNTRFSGCLLRGA